LISTI